MQTELTLSTKDKNSCNINTQIYVVIVLYNFSPAQSSSVTTILKAAEIAGQKLRILIYDNSKNKLENYDEINNDTMEYIHNPMNPGICKAYNSALEKACLLGYEWLLILDQDSILETDFINKTIKILNTNLFENAVAILPVVYGKSQEIISPAKWRYSRIEPFETIKTMQKVKCNNITAINSGMLVNTNYLREIGGYKKSFPLDMLDHWLMWKIGKDKKFVFFSNAILSHDLTCSELINVKYERHFSAVQSGLKLYSQMNILSFFVFFLSSIYRSILLSFVHKDLKFLKLWRYLSIKR